MSSNTLVAICVGCLFVTTVVTVVMAFLFAERTSMKQYNLGRYRLGLSPEEKVTEQRWAAGGEG